jgi:hypothetical protein
MIGCYGVFLDEASRPVAFFRELEDAMDWGLSRFGDDAFRIRYVEVARVERDEARPS